MSISSSCVSTKQVCKDHFTPVHASLHGCVCVVYAWLGLMNGTVASLKQNRILALYSLEHFTRLLLTIGILLVTPDTTPI